MFFDYWQGQFSQFCQAGLVEGAVQETCGVLMMLAYLFEAGQISFGAG